MFLDEIFIILCYICFLFKSLKMSNRCICKTGNSTLVGKRITKIYWKETGNFLGIQQVHSLLVCFSFLFWNFEKFIGNHQSICAYAPIDEHVRCSVCNVKKCKKNNIQCITVQKKRQKKTIQMHSWNLRERKRSKWTNFGCHEDKFKVKTWCCYLYIHTHTLHTDTKNKSV